MRTLQATLRAARITGCQSNTMQAFAALIEQCKRLCAAVKTAPRLGLCLLVSYNNASPFCRARLQIEAAQAKQAALYARIGYRGCPIHRA